MCAIAKRIPGTTPATKSVPMLVFDKKPKITIGILGGSSGPMMELVIVVPQAKPLGYPAPTIARTLITPIPAVSATALPVMPLNMSVPMTLTCASAPRELPSANSAKRKIRSVMPEVFIT